MERVDQSEEGEKEGPETSREDAERHEELDTGEQEGIEDPLQHPQITLCMVQL